jgi:prevent-host-death family protein
LKFNFNFNFNFMNQVTMLEFRSDSARILRRVQNGERVVLTHRGRPVARLEPASAAPGRCAPDDPIFHLDDFSFDGPRSKLKNANIDRVVYGA